MRLMLFVGIVGAIGFTPYEMVEIDAAISEWNKVDMLVDPSTLSIVRAYGDRLAYTETWTWVGGKVRLISINTGKLKGVNTLYNAMLHELGHYIGLRHNDDPRSIMNITILTDRDGYARDMVRHRLSLVDMCR